MALAAIQGLYQVVQEKESQIAALQAQNADQEKRLNSLETCLSNLENHNDRPAAGPYGLWFAIMSLFVGLVAGWYFLAPLRIVEQANI